MVMQANLFRKFILPACLFYFVLCVFLGGYPLNRFFIDSLFQGRIALFLLLLCLLVSYNAFDRWTNRNWLELIFCTALFTFAAYLRWNGLQNNFLTGPTVDERLVVPPVLKMIRTGTLDFRQYQYGGVSFYVLMAVFLAFTSKQAFRFEYKDFTLIPDRNYYQVGRIVCGAFGLLTVCLTYFTARKFFGVLAGIIATLLIAFSDLSYQTAHQVRIDLLLTLLVLSAHYFFLEILDRPTSLNYFLAGTFCGLAMGTKLTVAPIFVSLLLAHLLTKKERLLNGNILIAVFSGFGFFFLFNLPAFLHPDEFLQRLTVAIHHNLSPEHGTATSNRPLEYFRILAGQGIGYVSILPILVTLAMLFFQRDNKLLILWCFPALFLTHLGSYPSGFPRYLLPILPNLAILAGVGSQKILDWLMMRFRLLAERKNLIAFLIVLVVCVLPLWNALTYVRDMRNRLSPKVVVQWIDQNLPAHSIITIDPTGPLIPEDKFEVRMMLYRDFKKQDLNESDYVCVTEDLFREIPASFSVIKEFPRQTRTLDRSIRIYKVPH